MSIMSRVEVETQNFGRNETQVFWVLFPWSLKWTGNTQKNKMAMFRFQRTQSKSARDMFLFLSLKQSAPKAMFLSSFVSILSPKVGGRRAFRNRAAALHCEVKFASYIEVLTSFIIF